jgi:hypothetical protein
MNYYFFKIWVFGQVMDFPFFIGYPPDPSDPCLKIKKKKKTLTLPLISHFLSLSLSLPHSCLSPPHLFSLAASLPLLPHRPLHHLRSVIQISTRLPLLPHGLSTTSGPPFRSGLASFFSFTASPPPPLRFDLWFDLVFRLNFFFFYLVFRLDFLFGKFVVLIWFLG